SKGSLTSRNRVCGGRKVMHNIRHAASVDQPYRHMRQVSREEVQRRFSTNDGKGLTVNFIAVTDVVKHVCVTVREWIGQITVASRQWHSDWQRRQMIRQG